MKIKRIFLFLVFIFVSSLISLSLYNNNGGGGNLNNNQFTHQQQQQQQNKNIVIFNNKKDKYYNHERLKTVNSNNNENKVKQPTHENYLKKQRNQRPVGKKTIVKKISLDIKSDGGIVENTNFFELSMNTIECFNGGIGYSNKCICPFAFSGDKCEIIDSNEQCTNPTMEIEYMYNKIAVTTDSCVVAPSSLCCWSKYRTDLNISTNYFKSTSNNNNNSTDYYNDNEIIKSILTAYGPWLDNDKLMMKYLFKSNGAIGNNEYSLKYSKQSEKQTPPPQVNSREKSRLAFVLLIHNVDMEAIELLFSQIYNVRHYYTIHIDSNFKNQSLIDKLYEYVDTVHQEKITNNMFLKPGYPNNIEILKDRFKGAWGSIALVYSELAAYTSLFDMVETRQLFTGNGEKERWSHVINLSINDFPIRPLSELESFLSTKDNIGKSFLNEENSKEIERLNKPWVECENNLVGFNFNGGGSTAVTNQCGVTGIEMTIDRSKNFKEGSQWHFLTYEFANYLISNFNAINRLFSIKFSFIPDESYFQLSKSECYLSLLPDKFTTSNYRFIPWSSSRLTVNMTFIENNFNNEIWNFFTRKVYSTSVKNAIIEKYLKK